MIFDVRATFEVALQTYIRLVLVDMDQGTSVTNDADAGYSGKKQPWSEIQCFSSTVGAVGPEHQQGRLRITVRSRKI